ncbi:MAG: transcriptional regulator [Mycobacterium sp.]|nr:transcriptional regulator [Mycobacterium sp.]
MASPVSTDAAGQVDTRRRLIEVAVDLFTRHSFAGTSLQMIADELGFTKAAIYHHFRTREQLLDAVVTPILEQLTVVVDTAERLRGVHARADHVLTGFAQLAVDNQVVAVLASDPAVAEMLRTHHRWDHLIERQLALLADVEPGPAGMVKAAVALAGIAGASGPTFVNLDRDALREHLVDAGRKALGVRAPRRAATK